MQSSQSKDSIESDERFDQFRRAIPSSQRQIRSSQAGDWIGSNQTFNSIESVDGDSMESTGDSNVNSINSQIDSRIDPLNDTVIHCRVPGIFERRFPCSSSTYGAVESLKNSFCCGR